MIYFKEEINSNDIFFDEFFYCFLNCKDRVIGEKGGVFIVIYNDIILVE